MKLKTMTLNRKAFQQQTSRIIFYKIFYFKSSKKKIKLKKKVTTSKV